MRRKGIETRLDVPRLEVVAHGKRDEHEVVRLVSLERQIGEATLDELRV